MLADVLAQLAEHLEDAEISFAVVGGLAASARGEARFTRDIDVAVAVRNDPEAEACVFVLQQQGYLVMATVEQSATGRLATARLSHPSGTVCDLIFATCGVEEDIVALAESIELFAGRVVPTATAEALLAMKVLSASAHRPRDAEDIRAILRTNPGLDEGVVLGLLRAIERRGYARGQALLEKWKRLRAELGV